MQWEPIIVTSVVWFCIFLFYGSSKSEDYDNIKGDFYKVRFQKDNILDVILDRSLSSLDDYQEAVAEIRTIKDMDRGDFKTHKKKTKKENDNS